ncbi:pyruvate, water dikinase regulatory protein [Anaerotardibacter muris]|uniref:pyruvate, water dikinase regulatory protein n=1 Tax=Anaerotardibacter muris TaxID=2941505 RepID=UPI00203D3D1B|nr:pyruvate, water dikinase regulatory protein [Anaerotardibacter muris]
MQKWIVQGSRPTKLPTIHVVSDSTGITGKAIARAASASFGEVNPYIETLPSMKTPQELTEELTRHLAHHRQTQVPGTFIIFYTLVDEELRNAMHRFVEEAGEDPENPEVIAVDALAQAHQALSKATNRKPVPHPGALYSVNDQYFKRVAAIDFTINHDDGRNPQDLTKADIVLVGVSRSGKTPLSIYLSQLGYKVANVPLDGVTEPPKELFDVDPSRLFGLMISPELLAQVRSRRMSKAAGKDAYVAASYSELESVYSELETARDLMRKLGCIIIRTDNRAIEETAQEILRYYENYHPQF